MELAQVKISRLLAPLDSPQLEEFVDALDDDWLIVNMSVWESPETLLDYVSGEAHRAVLRGRRKWFHHPTEAMTALWWVPAGHRPSVAEAEERLVHLRAHGPSSHVFTLKQIYGEQLITSCFTPHRNI